MKKVYRSRHTRILGGVAGGLADYFGIDVTVMRLLFALLLVTLPNTMIAYILAWIIIPEEPVGAGSSVSDVSSSGSASVPQQAGASSGGMTAEEILKGKGESASSNPGDQEAGSSGASLAPAPAPVTRVESNAGHGSGDRSRQLLGYILIAVGAAVMIRKYVPSFVWRLPRHIIGYMWPVLIIVAGVAIILSAVKGR